MGETSNEIVEKPLALEFNDFIELTNKKAVICIPTFEHFSILKQEQKLLICLFESQLGLVIDNNDDKVLNNRKNKCYILLSEDKEYTVINQSTLPLILLIGTYNNNAYVT